MYELGAAIGKDVHHRAEAVARDHVGNREHAQLVTAVIKNTQSSGSKGFAPDCKTYSANKFSLDAL